MRIAAIDLGTNTFNLLVADADANNYIEVYRDKRAVKLGHGGITKKHISDEAIERGILAIKDYTNAIAPMRIDKILAVATSAIRTTDNGLCFTKRLKKEFNLDVRIIGGDEEAELIYSGIRRAVNIGSENVLMLDIGGGSNEFIIGNNNSISWKQSFPLGIARLLELFKPSDPLTLKEIDAVLKYLETELKPLVSALKMFPVKTLIGSSGSFDTLANICSIEKTNEPIKLGSTSYCFDKLTMTELSEKIIYSSTHERINMPGMDLMRVEMIPLSTLFIKYVLQVSQVQEIIQSAYAIKEGIIFSYSEK